jgi:hypothetical protein
MHVCHAVNFGSDGWCGLSGAFTAIHHHITNLSSLGITTALFDKNMILTL